MKSIKRLLIINISLFLLTSCMQDLSPAIYYKNISTNKIYKVRGAWNRYHLHGSRNELNPGQTSSENFAIDNKSDFFGPVHLEWENAVGKKFTKDFVFKREELPTYLLWDFQIERLDREYHRNGANGVNKGYVRVEFYFDQDGVKYITSDNPDFERVHKQYHEQEEKNKRIFLGLDKK